VERTLRGQKRDLTTLIEKREALTQSISITKVCKVPHTFPDLEKLTTPVFRRGTMMKGHPLMTSRFLYIGHELFFLLLINYINHLKFILLD